MINSRSPPLPLWKVYWYKTNDFNEIINQNPLICLVNPFISDAMSHATLLMKAEMEGGNPGAQQRRREGWDSKGKATIASHYRIPAANQISVAHANLDPTHWGGGPSVM